MARLPHASVAQASPFNNTGCTVANFSHLSRHSFNSMLPFPFRPKLSFLGFQSKWSGRCQASSPGPPSPDSEPPFDNEAVPTSDFETTFSRFQDRVQIFFAVFFWMSLFFWACASDGWNNNRPNKGSRFRR